MKKNSFVLCGVILSVGCGGEEGVGGAGGGAAVTTSSSTTGTTTSANSTGQATGGAAPLQLGEVCSAGTACESGSCVDGVCCESACDGLCSACVSGATGKPDGTCAPITGGTDPEGECAASLGCQTGTCDGKGACGVLPAETLCRPSAGACDTAEACDGLAADCPTDVLVASGLSCRAAVSECDAEEVCDGANVDCPANAVLGTNTTCGGYQCDGASDLCPTTCTTDKHCAHDFACVANVCTPGRRVFITSITHDGNLGGLNGGDQLCQTSADTAGVGGTYRMWLADATGSPSTRFDASTVPYYRFDGVMVATSFADLTDGTLLAPLDVNEGGGVVSSNVPFTGAAADGTAANLSSPSQDNCSAWTSSSATQHAWTGQSDGMDLTWTLSSNSGSPRACSVLHRFYCFEQ